MDVKSAADKLKMLPPMVLDGTLAEVEFAAQELQAVGADVLVMRADTP